MPPHDPAQAQRAATDAGLRYVSDRDPGLRRRRSRSMAHALDFSGALS